MERLSRAAGWAWTLLLASMLGGCATYSATRGALEASLAAGQYEQALKQLAEQPGPERDRVLHLLDRAMLQRLAGDYGASNASFEEAKALIEEFSTVSATETSATFIINDATTTYVGEPFEQALLHAYAALNYLDLGNDEAARVEALQVDLTLEALAEDDDGPLASDPFARYLAGIIYERRGELSDALISYRKAYQAYKAHAGLYPIDIPASLKEDLLRLTARVGLKNEHRKFREEFGVSAWKDPGRKEGELIVLLHNGLAPIKREDRAVILPPRAPQVVTIALPRYEPRPAGVSAARVVAGDREARTEIVEDVNAIAQHTLSGRMPAITARALARAVAKFKITESAQKENKAAGLITNVAGLLTERADTRSWLTLPAEIQMARLRLPAGDHHVRLELLSPAGGVVETHEFDVSVAKGGQTVLSRHWIPSLSPRRTP
ncbi:MAG: COG3014 family protein [Thiohalomonadaceae bacterium]